METASCELWKVRQEACCTWHVRWMEIVLGGDTLRTCTKQTLQSHETLSHAHEKIACVTRARCDVQFTHLSSPPSLTRESLFPASETPCRKKGLFIFPATLETATRLMCQWRQATKSPMRKKKMNLTKFSIPTVSILTFVSLPLFDVLRLVAVGTVDLEGYMDLDSLLVLA